MYIIKKKVKGKEYYYLRKAVREKNKVISKDIAYLGKKRKEAEKKMREFLKQKELKEKPLTIDELAAFCKRKGFIFKSSEIYGGLSGFWDFGPLGVELFNNIKQNWWKFFVQEKENMVGIEASVISHPKTWRASGHLTSFSDIAVICKKCKKATKIDKGE